MATITLGTAGTTTLVAIPFTYGMVPADFATIAVSIKLDSHNSNVMGITGPQPPIGTPFSRAGVLIIPGRGSLALFPGDYVGVDASGWPILLSPRAAASASWVHT